MRTAEASDARSIVLALGSGAARGWAHIGVLRALDELGVRVTAIAGTSMGALVGAAYAAGRLDALETIARRLDWRDVLYYFSDVAFTGAGLVDGRKIVRFLAENIGTPLIEALPLPYRAIATDLHTGEAVVFARGDLLAAVRASISIPGIFTPFTTDAGSVLVDGGLVDPVPVSVARSLGLHPVVAVDVNHGMVQGRAARRAAAPSPRAIAGAEAEHLIERIEHRLGRQVRQLDALRRWAQRRGPNLFDVLGNTVRIMECRVTEATLAADPPDILLRPAVGHIDTMEFHRVEEAIDAGYATAHAAFARA